MGNISIDIGIDLEIYRLRNIKKNEAKKFDSVKSQ